MSNPASPAAEPGIREFLPRESVGLKAAMSLAGGVLWLLMLAAWFVVLLASNKPAQSHVPGMIGGLCVPAIFSIAYGISLLRSPKRIRLDPLGLTIDGFTSSKRFSWSQISQLRREKSSGMMQQKQADVLVLVDEKGKELVRIRDVFKDFAGLLSDIEAASAAARGTATYDRDAELQRKVAQQRKKRVRMILLSIPFFCLGTAGAIWGAHDWIKERQLATSGIVVDAPITRRYMVRVTPRLEYSITDASGQVHTNEVMMEQRAWDALAGAKTVAVRYLPSDPAWSHPLVGEDSEHSPLLLVVCGCVMAVLFGGMLVMQLLGITDIATENGKLVIKRLGDVDDSLEKPAGVVNPLPQKFIQPPPPPMAEATGKLPTGIQVIATLNLIIGFLGVAANFLSAIIHLRGLTFDAPQGTIEIPQDIPLGLWSLGDLVLAAILMVAGIGLLMRQGWARWLSLIVAVPQIISTIGVLVLQVYTLSSGDFVAPDSQAARVGMVLGVAFRALGMVYPIIVLIVLTRPFARAALKSQGELVSPPAPGGGGSFPLQ